MGKYLLTDWEINGYDDSDFMCTYYDDVADVIGAHCYGTTRAAAPTMIGISADGTTSVEIGGDVLRLPTKEIVERARIKLEDFIFGLLEREEQRRVHDPDVKDLTQGLRVRTKIECKNQMSLDVDCDKCGGSGNWTNPRNDADKRECFACKGSGVKRGPKLKTEDGKPKWEKIPAGTTGMVIRWGSFGTFYRNGYNQPNPDNTSVQFRTDEGKVVRSTLKNLRMDRECKTAEELRVIAKDMSFGYGFSRIYPRAAWDTYNHALMIAKS